jgi:hypothetical protein
MARTLITQKIHCPACGSSMPVDRFGLSRDGVRIQHTPIEHEPGISAQYSIGRRRMLWELQPASREVLQALEMQLDSALHRVRAQLGLE